MTEYISYLRVSKKGKDYTGLSFEAQQKTISDYISKSNGVLVAEYQEIMTGTHKKRRVEVYKAIAEAKKRKATLIVAKLDRLARDVEFISAIQKMDIDIVFCDFPQANKLVIGIMALLAEYEAGLISQRTKDALSALKARGVKLGNPNVRKISKIGAAARSSSREAGVMTQNTQVANLIKQARRESKTYQQIADSLNEMGLRTTFKKEFTEDNVRMINRSSKKALA